jgi:hypothetical protein
MENQLCDICNNNVKINFINLSNEQSTSNPCNLKICNNCFHIQSNNDKCTYKNLDTKDSLFKLIVNKIESNKFNNPIKILNMNDNNTKLLDDLYFIYHRDIKTVSLSNLFNPSFFSKHICYKDDLTDWSFEMIKNLYNTFDIIILNSTLTFNKNINDILEKCKKLSHKNTVLLSTSYDILNIHSHVFFLNLNNNIKNIFNTNSMNRLCNKHDLQLINKHTVPSITEKYYNKIVIYEINASTNKLKNNSNSITEDLYNEITLNLYDENIYKTISNNWIKNYNLFNDIIQKYNSQNYNIVIIDKYYTNLINCNNINLITNLNDINIHDKNLFISFDFENFEQKCLDLKLEIQLNYKLNLSKCLILDINLLITYPIYN